MHGPYWYIQDKSTLPLVTGYTERSRIMSNMPDYWIPRYWIPSIFDKKIVTKCWDQYGNPYILEHGGPRPDWATVLFFDPAVNRRMYGYDAEHIFFEEEKPVTGLSELMYGYKDPTRQFPQLWVPGRKDAKQYLVIRKTSAGECYNLIVGGEQPNWAVKKLPHSVKVDSRGPIYIYGIEPLIQKQEHIDVQKDTNNFTNFVDREHYKTTIVITDFAQLPQFFINTPSFQFDSHNNTAGWRLDVRQRWYANRPGKLTMKLIHGSYKDGEGIRIRIAGDAVKHRIATVEDVAALFEGEFDIIHSGKMNIVPRVRKLDSYSDEELLAELTKRSLARLNGYRGPQPVFDLSNVIDIDSIRQRDYDDTKLDEILAA